VRGFGRLEFLLEEGISCARPPTTLVYLLLPPLTQTEQQQWHVVRSAALGSWGTSRRSATASAVDRLACRVAAEFAEVYYIMQRLPPLGTPLVSVPGGLCATSLWPLPVSRFFQATHTAWVVYVLHCTVYFSVTCTALHTHTLYHCICTLASSQIPAMIAALTACLCCHLAVYLW
jgi:hypothetical protein